PFCGLPKARRACAMYDNHNLRAGPVARAARLARRDVSAFLTRGANEFPRQDWIPFGAHAERGPALGTGRRVFPFVIDGSLDKSLETFGAAPAPLVRVAGMP